MTAPVMPPAKACGTRITVTDRSRWRVLLLLCTGVASVGCTTPFEGRYDFYDAWRKGKVVEVGVAQGLGRSSQQDCRKDGQTRTADTRYAYVQYRGISRLTSRIVPLAADAKLKAGDLVYVKVNDCNAPVPLRAVQADTW